MKFYGALEFLKTNYGSIGVRIVDPTDFEGNIIPEIDWVEKVCLFDDFVDIVKNCSITCGMVSDEWFEIYDDKYVKYYCGKIEDLDYPEES